MTITPLYRTEVLEAKRNRWLGRLILRQPMSHWLMTWVAIGLTVAVVVFLITGEYAKKVRIEGRLVDTSHAPDTRPLGHVPDRISPLRASRLVVELTVPENLLASTNIGGEVLLRYPAFPYQRYGQYRGRITSISRQPLAWTQPSQIGAESSQVRSAYRATVSIDHQRVRDDHGIERDLRPGLGVEASIVIEKHRLYEWLLQPLSRARKRPHG